MAPKRAQSEAQPTRRSTRIRAKVASDSTTEDSLRTVHDGRISKPHTQKSGEGTATSKKPKAAASEKPGLPKETESLQVEGGGATPTFGGLPDELLLNVLKHLHHPANLVALSYTASKYPPIVKPVLYMDVYLAPDFPLNGRQPRPLRFLKTILEKPALVAKTRSLRLHIGRSEHLEKVSEELIDLVIHKANRTHVHSSMKFGTYWRRKLREFTPTSKQRSFTRYKTYLRDLLVAATEVILVQLPELKLFEFEDWIGETLLDSSNLEDRHLTELLPKLDSLDIFNHTAGRGWSETVRRFMEVVPTIEQLSVRVESKCSGCVIGVGLTMGSCPNIKKLTIQGETLNISAAQEMSRRLKNLQDFELHLRTDKLRESANTRTIFHDMCSLTSPLAQQLRRVVITQTLPSSNTVQVKTEDFIAPYLQHMANIEEITLDEYKWLKDKIDESTVKKK